MSDVPQGPGWWQASDGRWYPPTARPGTPPPAAGPPPPYGTPPAGYGYGYPLNPNGTTTGLPSVNGYAIASLVLGICSVVICCWPLAFGSLVGLPLGIYALTRITGGAADPKGKGIAIAGVVLNSIGLVLLVLIGVLTAAS